MSHIERRLSLTGNKSTVCHTCVNTFQKLYLSPSTVTMHNDYEKLLISSIKFSCLKNLEITKKTNWNGSESMKTNSLNLKVVNRARA